MYEITQKDMVAYIVYSSKKITKYSDKTLDNYIEKFEEDLINTPIGHVLFEIDLRLFNNFNFKAELNHSEIMCYAKLIYQRLLRQVNREFSNEDIIEKSEYIFQNYSTRKAKEKVIEEKL